MALEIDKVQLGELVRELSPEALDYFASLRLSDEWPRHKTPLEGKFVRLGKVIVLGAYIDFGPEIRGKRDYVTHRSLMNLALYGMGEDPLKRIEESAPADEQYLRGQWPLVDAGYSTVQIDGTGKPYGLLLGEDSFEFGRPNATIRQETAEVAQSTLGHDFEIIVE